MFYEIERRVLNMKEVLNSSSLPPYITASTYKFSWVEFLVIIPTVISILLDLFILSLSLLKIKNDSFKIFTLNLYASCIVADLFTSFRRILALLSFCTPIVISITSIVKILLVSVFIQIVVIIEYPMMSLFFVTLSYLAYAAPFFYAKHFAARSWLRYYIAIHFCAYSICVISIWALLSHYIDVGVFINEFFVYLMSILSLITLFATIKALITVVRYRSGAFSSSYERKRRRRLRCFIIYCIPMNIIGLPYIAIGAMNLIQLFYPTSFTLQNFMRIAQTAASDINSYRTIAIGLSTLTALTPYRNALASLFNCRRRSARVSTMERTAY